MCKCGAILVGGAAQHFVLKGEKKIKDYDLIVPPEKWYIVSLLIPKSARLNKHGGLKFKDDKGNEIDVWPCSIEQHLCQCHSLSEEKDFVVDIINRRVFSSRSF